MKRLRCGFVAVAVTALLSASAGALGPFEPDLQIQSVSVPAGPGTMLAPPRDLRTDLAVESMTPSATSALPGERIAVQARVANRGNTTTVASSASLVLRPRTGPAQLLQTIGVPRLEAGRTHATAFVATLAATVAPGAYTLAVAADSDNAFTESDEENNEATVEFTVAGPDLQGCSSLRVTPGSVRPGDTIAIYACIQNLGSAEAPSVPYRLVLSASRRLDSPRVLRQSAGGEPLGIRGILNLNWSNVVVPADLTPATYYLGVLIDPDSRIAEVNERNNTHGPLALEVTP